MSESFIQQQMYTRERGGIFHESTGYDTIAMSEGLNKAFVKKYLHPFCVYHSPKTLSERGEKDPSLYPEAITIFQPETGELVIGQAVFVPADFTGERSTFFMHNYIIPSSVKEEWVRHSANIFQAKGFQTSYTINLGSVLPELEAITNRGEEILSSKESILTNLGIPEECFIQLLFAIMSSIVGKKKVFISLNVPLQDYTQSALQLLELLYLYLPYAHRRKLGAMTFSSEPEGRNYIHVQFFEPGTLNRSDRAIEKQFIFDFGGDSRVTGVDLDGREDAFLALASLHFSQSEKLDEFFDFAETALSGLAEEKKLELSSYSQLTALYLIFQTHNYSLYKKDPIAFLDSLFQFLQVNGQEKSILVQLLRDVLSMELRVTDSTIAVDYIESLLSLKQIVDFDEMVPFIFETLAYFQNDSLFLQLWQAVEKYHSSYQVLLTFANENASYESLVELYMRVSQDFLVTQVLDQVINNSSLAPLDRLASLTEAAREQLREALERYLQITLTPKEFPLLFIAFDSETDGINYDGVFKHLSHYSNDETMMSFISKYQQLIDTDTRYKKSLQKYLCFHSKSIWTNKFYRKELKRSKNSSFKAFLKGIDMETGSSFIKFLRK